MKVELLVTLKGTTTWRRGTVFDDAVSPIPGDILREIDNPQVIRVIPRNPFAVAHRIAETPFEGTTFEWGKLPEINDYDDDSVDIEVAPDLEIEVAEPEPSTDYLIELDALIDQSSLKRTAAILNSPYQRLAMWRAKRKKPTEEEIQKIHEEYMKVSG